MNRFLPPFHLSDSDIPSSARGSGSPERQGEAGIEAGLSVGMSLNVEMLARTYPTQDGRVINIRCTSIKTLGQNLEFLIKYFLFVTSLMVIVSTRQSPSGAPVVVGPSIWKVSKSNLI